MVNPINLEDRRKALQPEKQVGTPCQNYIPMPPTFEAVLAFSEKTMAWKPTLSNVTKILDLHADVRGRLKFDLLKSQVVITGAMPWSASYDRPWTDQDDRQFAIWLQERNCDVKVETVRQAIETVAKHREFHPVVDYLNNLKWDTEPRIEFFLERYLGADISTNDRAMFVRAVSRKFMISAVARVMKPGCKVDTCIVLEGDQGLGKSKAIRTLFGSEYFSDDLADIGAGKAAAEALLGIWCLEFAELAAMQKTTVVETIKAFMSRQTDRYRPAYGYRVQEFPRQCVFMASTNEASYLRDATGARRFWPIKCSEIDIAALRADRDQLWAEAVVSYNAGEKWWLSPEEEAAAKIEQDERQETDVWSDKVMSMVWDKDETTSSEILQAIGVPVERQDRGQEMRVGKILRLAGWRSKPVRRNGVLARVWRRGG